jgi:hypothetical protein
MLNRAFGSTVIAGWIATLAMIVAASVAMGADVSTTALLLALGVAPAIVTVLIAGGTPSPSVTQILYAVDTKDRRA